MTGKLAGKQPAKVRIVTKIITEALDDVNDVPTAIGELYCKQLSMLLWWVATGEKRADMTDWPDDFDTDRL
jgi:hypothetical protein